MARRSSVSSGAWPMVPAQAWDRARQVGLWRRSRRPRLPLTWRLSLSGSPAPIPTALPRALLQRILAYRIQADAAGDLDPTTIKLLDRLGRGEIAEIPLPELRAVKPGTLLVREWEGTLQR